MHKILTLVLAGVMGTAAAADLPGCQLDGNALVSSVMERSRLSADWSSTLLVTGPLRNGATVSYAKDDPVLVVDLQVMRATPALVPTVNVLLRNSWALSPNFRFAAERPLFVPRELVLESGQVFKILRLTDGSALFVDAQGHFCNKALNARAQPNVWMAGTLSQEPDEVPLVYKVIEELGESGSLRIIFNGLGAGQMSFQEVWVNGATVVSSTARNFDQFAKVVKIGPFAFEIVEAGGGKVSLRYEIAERAPINASDLAKWPLRQRR